MGGKGINILGGKGGGIFINFMVIMNTRSHHKFLTVYHLIRAGVKSFCQTPDLVRSKD